MTTYESDIKTISSSEEVVFNILSDLSNLQKLQNLPVEGQENLKGQLDDVQFDTDSISFSVVGIGRIGFRIVEREPYKTIKLESEHSPIDVKGWIQLKQISENDTRMKLTLKAELPMMIKMMVDSKLQKGINALADTIARGLSMADLNSPSGDIQKEL